MSRSWSIASVLSSTLVAAMLGIGFAAPARALPPNTRVDRYKGDLDFPVDMAWVKGTEKILFTEKNTGKIRILKNGNLLDRACVNLDVNNSGERGALGIALHPDFEQNHKLYVYFTSASPLENRVTRFIVEHNRCEKPRAVVKGIPSSTIHNGGQIEFMRGKLFVAVGEAGDPANAQSTGNRLGKILRYTPGGKIPDNNPFSAPGDPSPVWTIGHRNPFGLAHKPGSKKLFSSENGPSCDDELNRIRKGENYGWGNGYQCGTAGVGPSPKPPIKRWGEVIVPTDLWWYKGSMQRLNNDLYMGDYEGRLHRLVMNAKATNVREDRVIHTASDGIVDVSKGPGGRLFFMTENAIFRIVPN